MTEQTQQDWLASRLQESFNPDFLDIEDQSYLHAGHQGNTGGSHFKVIMVSQTFAGQSRIKRHQAVYQLCADKIPHEIHALSLSLYTPDEYKSKKK